MSQKPRSGVPNRAASVKPAAPRELAAKADSEPVVKAGPEPMIEAGPEPLVGVDPVPAELVASTPEIKPTPVAEVASGNAPSYLVDETIAATSDLAAAAANAASATITATADTVAAVTSEAVETVASIKPTQPTITQGMKTMMKTTEDFVAFGQANLEAFVKSGQIWSAGVQELTKQIATSAKASFDESISTFKAMSTVKSVKEAMDLQSSFAKAALEKAMAESNKLTDASIKLTEQTLAPITARVTVAVETFGKAA